MGSTPTGRDWCIKALHPSDPMTEVRGIPDQSAIPSVFMNYQTVATISAPAGIASTQTWQVDAQLMPHPVGFCSGIATTSDGHTGGPFEILNSQLVGTTHTACAVNWFAQFVRWRLAYAAVTVYQDGPDLANQGTIVVCQKPVQPLRTNPANIPVSAANPYVMTMPHAFTMGTFDSPNYIYSQGMPNAYFGRSRDGAYVPLKLTRTHQEWHSAADWTFQLCSGTRIAPGATSYCPGTVVPADAASATTGGFYPFLTFNDLHVNTGDGNLYGDVTSEFCNDVWADISTRNLAPTTSLSLFFRMGFECQVYPGTTLAPQMKLSPPYDPQALDAYFQVARELKDAYPADYNDLGKIWDVISSAAKAVLPVVAAIPGFGPIASAVGGGVVSAGDAIRSAVSKASEPARGSTASAAQIETARQALQRPQVLVVSKALRKRIAKKKGKKGGK